MLVGYARTSTVEQQAGFEAQIRDLLKERCEKLFQEQVSSVQVRVQLKAALDFIREGDTLIVTRLDRLARSTSNLVEITSALEKKGANLRILDLGMDTGTPTGRLMLNLLGAIAQFEREIMLERQREGISRAKELGKYKGRKPTARSRTQEVLELHGKGLGATAIARELNMARASVYRCLESSGGHS
ncbi:MAG: recombinase family protein [Magnetococcales bacterium]|nr:recombinase family protein [Magnetococcales bacterium]